VAETLAEVERHMDGLTQGIVETTINQIPMRLQHHTIVVPDRIIQLLCKMACIVTCYHEHHDYFIRRLIYIAIF